MNDDILMIPEVGEFLRNAERNVYMFAQLGEIPDFKAEDSGALAAVQFKRGSTSAPARGSQARRRFLLNIRPFHVRWPDEVEDTEARVTPWNVGLAVAHSPAEEGIHSLPCRPEANDCFGWDAGPYSTRINSKGSLVKKLLAGDHKRRLFIRDFAPAIQHAEPEELFPEAAYLDTVKEANPVVDLAFDASKLAPTGVVSKLQALFERKNVGTFEKWRPAAILRDRIGDASVKVPQPVREVICRIFQTFDAAFSGQGA